MEDNPEALKNVVDGVSATVGVGVSLVIYRHWLGFLLLYGLQSEYGKLKQCRV